MMKKGTGITRVRNAASVGTLCLLGGFAVYGGGGKAAAAAPGAVQAAALPAGGASSAAVPASYSAINLGAGTLTELPAINANGQVAFSVSSAGAYRAGFFNGNSVRDIGTLGGNAAFATDLNNAGHVVGRSLLSASDFYHAYRWTEAKGITDLDKIGNRGESAALAINKTGRITGYFGAALEPLHAFVWTDAKGMVDIGTTADGMSVGLDINDDGMVAGYSDEVVGDTHAFAWTPATGFIDLGTLGGIDSYATHINNAGQVGGYSATRASTDPQYHGFVWNVDSGMLDIGTLGGAQSAVLAMNGAGQVAGVADKGDGNQHAVVWTRQGGMVDLGTLGGTASRALGINGNGHIVGWSNTAAGEQAYRAFLWSVASGLVDLNGRISNAPPGMELTEGLAISDSGAIVANSNAGLVLLRPGANGTDAPVVGPITTVGSDPVRVRTRIMFNAGFVDRNPNDRHSATWTWNDASMDSPGTIARVRDGSRASGNHVYRAPGVYPVVLTVADSTGRMSRVERDIVVYDPAEGSVAGGGWFASPRGALKKEKTQAGRATFAFAKDGTGRVKLRFNVGKLNFEGDSHGPLQLAGSRAQYQGSGKINGVGNYNFMMTASDGPASATSGQGRLRIKIWHTDPRTKSEVVDYDNLPSVRSTLAQAAEGSVIGSGRIVIRQ